MSESPSLMLPLLAAEQAQKHVTMNEALGLVDALVQLSVKDRHLTAPPASPTEGDRYIVAPGATGAWAGKSNHVAIRQNGGWIFRPPREGWRCWVDDENVLLIFDGAAWDEFAGTPSELQNLSLLGVGTTADATNPFSAKLNKALWAAKTIAEGGDGDLRYTLNKEAAADTLSLLLQTGFSGRAEIGLIGDDDLALKVSADGSAWLDALKISRSSGLLTTLGQIKFPATQNASADANTLDDYEEGTFTPTLTFGTPGNLSVSYAEQIGSYTKIGRAVAYALRVTGTMTYTTATGVLYVDGLPFAGAANGIGTGCNMGAVSGLTFNPNQLQVQAQHEGSGSTRIFFAMIRSGATFQAADISNVPSGTSFRVHLAGVYVV